MNNLLFYVANLAALSAAVFLVRRILLTRVIGRPAKKSFVVDSDQNFIDAVILAKNYKQVNSVFLRRKLKVDKNTADNLIDRLVDAGIVAEPNERGMAEVAK